MKNKIHSLNNAFNEGKRKAKDTKKKGQIKVIFKSFFERPKTMKEVSEETGIMRSNICRYVAKLKKSNRIQVLYFGACPVTSYKNTQFLTTDKDLFVEPQKPLEDESK